MMEFLAGGPLTTSEQHSLAKGIAADGPGAAGLCAKLQALEQKMRNDAEFAAQTREDARRGYATGTGRPPGLAHLYQAEAAIMAAHDPVVAVNATYHVAITEATLREVRAAAAWIAQASGAAPPDAAFVDRARAALKARFAGADEAMAGGLAHIAWDRMYLDRFFAGMNTGPNAARKASLLRQVRADIEAAPNPEERAWRAVHDAAVLTLTARQLVQQGMVNGFMAREMRSQQMMWNGLINRQMQQNVWQLRHPECAPGGGNPSSCGAAPILQTPNIVP